MAEPERPKRKKTYIVKLVFLKITEVIKLCWNMEGAGFLSIKDYLENYF